MEQKLTTFKLCMVPGNSNSLLCTSTIQKLKGLKVQCTEFTAAWLIHSAQRGLRATAKIGTHNGQPTYERFASPSQHRCCHKSQSWVASVPSGAERVAQRWSLCIALLRWESLVLKKIFFNQCSCLDECHCGNSHCWFNHFYHRCKI